MLNLNPATVISRIIILVIAFSVHEFSHAWVADYFGDDTPRANGRLTLNPLAHLDLMGSLLLIFAGFGWAKPVPINPYALTRRSPSAVMWVSLAGPFSNLLLAVLAAIPFRLVMMNNTFFKGGLFPSPGQFLFEFMFINLTLMLFNLIPIAPLDGEKIFEYFLPPPLSRVFESIRPYGPIILLGLVFLAPMVGVNILGLVITPVITTVMRLLGVPI